MTANPLTQAITNAANAKQAKDLCKTNQPSQKSKRLKRLFMIMNNLFYGVAVSLSLLIIITKIRLAFDMDTSVIETFSAVWEAYMFIGIAIVSAHLFTRYED